MDEPIEMPFEIWTRVDPGNHVLGGDPDRAGERQFGGHAPVTQPIEEYEYPA